MSNEIIKRLSDLLRALNLSQNQFAMQLGVSQPNFNQIMNGKRAFGKNLQRRVVAEFGVSSQWLLTGEGEKFRKPEVTPEEDSPSSDNINNLVHEQNGRRMIPFYDAETTGGYNDCVSSSTTSVTLQGYINAGDWFAGRETAAIRHVGDSMVEYPDGCVLAVKEVREFRLLVPGRNYVVETDEYRVTKRIQKGHSSDYIALYSSNQEKYEDGRLVYEPFEVMLSDVRRIYSILGYIVNQSGEARLITP